MSTSGTKEETRYSSLFDVAVMPTASLPACLCEGISPKETEHDGKKHEVFFTGCESVQLPRFRAESCF